MVVVAPAFVFLLFACAGESGKQETHNFLSFELFPSSSFSLFASAAFFKLLLLLPGESHTLGPCGRRSAAEVGGEGEGVPGPGQGREGGRGK